MDAPKIKVDTARLGELMNNMKQGNIRVPRFQREFVWGHKMTAALLDSMSREYPVGTFFLWQAPPRYHSLIRTTDDLGQPELEENKELTGANVD